MEEKIETRRGIERTGSFVLPSASPRIDLVPLQKKELNKKDRNLSRFRFGKWNKQTKKDKRATEENERLIMRQELRLQTRKKSRPHTSDHQDFFLRTAWIAEEIKRTEPLADTFAIEEDVKSSTTWQSKRHPPVNMDGPALRLKLIYKNGMRAVDKSNRRRNDCGPDVKKKVLNIGMKAIESFDARSGMDVSDLASLDPYTFCTFHV